MSDLGDILNKVVVVNDIDNLKYASKNSHIFADGTITDLIDWTNTYKDKTGQDSSHGCRGACIGLCVGGCYNTADGIDGSNNGKPPGKSGSPLGCSCSGDACANACLGGCEGGC